MEDRMYAGSATFVDSLAEGNMAASQFVKDQEGTEMDYDTVLGHSLQKAKAGGSFDQDFQLDAPGVNRDTMGRLGVARTYTEDSCWEVLGTGGEKHLDDQK